MFKKQKKTDFRVRFQNSNFKQKLVAQRSYKRITKSQPVKLNGKVFAKIGLASWQSKIIVLIVLCSLTYLLYIPNIFFVKKITILGVNSEDKSSIQDNINLYIKKNLPLPQKNLLLLSKTALKNYLIQNNNKILSVPNISKKFPNTLIIQIIPRISQFLLKMPSHQYLISNDGMATEELTASTTSTLLNSLKLIKIDSDENIPLLKVALPSTILNFISEIDKKIIPEISSSISYYRLDSITSPDLTLYMNNGIKIYFDLHSDPDDAFTKFKTLYTQIPSTDLQKLYYIDMRLIDKAYVCLKGLLCVKDINLPNNNASTTPLTN